MLPTSNAPKNFTQSSACSEHFFCRKKCPRSWHPSTHQSTALYPLQTVVHFSQSTPVLSSSLTEIFNARSDSYTPTQAGYCRHHHFVTATINASNKALTLHLIYPHCISHSTADCNPYAAFNHTSACRRFHTAVPHHLIEPSTRYTPWPSDRTRHGICSRIPLISIPIRHLVIQP